MSKVLKTGDVKRYQFGMYIDRRDSWAIIRLAGYLAGRRSRHEAREDRLQGERIARVLSIGPKLVTVRVEK